MDESTAFFPAHNFAQIENWLITSPEKVEHQQGSFLLKITFKSAF
jgi:hypothetical protein